MKKNVLVPYAIWLVLTVSGLCEDMKSNDGHSVARHIPPFLPSVSAS